MISSAFDIAEVDFSDAKDVEGFAMLLHSTADGVGLFTDEAHPDEAYELRRVAKAWIYGVEDNIDSFSAGDALNVVGFYDLIYGLAFKSAAGESFLNKYRIRAFEALIDGDRSVNEYHLQRTISREICRRNKVFFDRPLRWESRCIDRWHKQFRFGMSFERMSDYDNIQRVKSLLDRNLQAYEVGNEARFKRSLFDNSRHYFTETAGKSLSTLLAIDSLLGSSLHFLPLSEYREYDTAISRALLSNNELNRFLRRSVEMREKGLLFF